jgi:hypothetical protein
MHFDILRRLWKTVRTKRPEKINNQQLVPSSRQCSTTPVGLGQGFLNKKQCDHEYPPYSPNLVPVEFLPVPATEISTEETALL